MKSGATVERATARSLAIDSSSVLKAASAFSLRISRSAISVAKAASCALSSVIRELISSMRIITSSSTSSSSARRTPKVPTSCCNCPNSFGDAEPPLRRASSRVMRETICSTSASARSSSRFTSLSSVCAPMRRSRALCDLVVRLARRACSARVWALWLRALVS
ncbi:unannotated protein [freshwater metagenome]|uniref:Unannotated protein n=1 Tax=freshwater metagenome TaxID=449393 RepID=A0A6J7B9K0_9ZZZZ